jgi:hypothetical protein
MDRLRRRWGTDAATLLIEFRLSNRTSSGISISPGISRLGKNTRNGGMSEGEIGVWRLARWSDFAPGRNPPRELPPAGRRKH